MTCADEIWTGARPLPDFLVCSVDDGAGRFCETVAEGAMMLTGRVSQVVVVDGGQERVLRCRPDPPHFALNGVGTGTDLGA